MMPRSHRQGFSMKNATTGMIWITLISALFTSPLSANSEDPMHDRGRYLLKISGCNDCHTPGYAQSGGAVPEKDWLTGDSLGWRGPWGTTYPSNLRRYMQTISEEQWLARAKNRQYRPPMPWFALRDMSEDDLRAIYRFTKHLGSAGDPAPAYLAPEQMPGGPFVQFPAPPAP